MEKILWQKLYDEYVQDNSYQGKLEKENDRLKTKLDKINTITEGITQESNPMVIKWNIKEVLERE